MAPRDPASADDAGVRAFVALELETALRDRIAELQERLRPQLRGIRFVSAATTHLTLRFLGKTTKAQVGALEPMLRAAAAACPPLEAAARGLSTFPGHGSPRILWLGLELPEAGLALQRACEQAARAAGFEAEPRAFRPHLTLGRWRERVPRPTLPDADLGRARLEWVTLFRSELRQEGASHTALVRAALDA
jgi:2'-5' RNA ligase